MSYRAIDALRSQGARSTRLSSSPASATIAPSRDGRRRVAQVALLFATVLAAGSALALITGTWTTNGSTSATSNVSGITVTWTGAADQNYANGTFNATTTGGWWTDPHGGTVPGGASLVMLHDSGTRNYTVTFSKAVDNPVLHIDRIGGAIGNDPNTSRWTLGATSATGGAVTMTELSGNPQFVLSGSSFFRQTGTSFSGDADGECRTGNTASVARGTACGSIRFNGTGITSLTFSVAQSGPTGGDELELRWSFPGASLIVRKQTVGGTGTFPISASGALSQNVSLTTTAQSTPVASATLPITNHASAITLTEADVAGYSLSAATCVDQGNATVAATVNTAGRTITIPSANYRANQTITCTITNSARVTDVSVTKSTAAGTVVSGQVLNFTIVVSNAGPFAADGTMVNDPPSAGLTCPVAGNPITCAASGGGACPGAGALPALVGSGVAIPTLPSGGAVTFTVPCQVTASGF